MCQQYTWPVCYKANVCGGTLAIFISLKFCENERFFAPLRSVQINGIRYRACNPFDSFDKAPLGKLPSSLKLRRDRGGRMKSEIAREKVHYLTV
jgi:hypothetical protein